MDGEPTTAPGITERLGSYELLRLVGEGSMGRVYEARHVKLDRQVALKVLRSEQANDAQLVRRFFQEARTVNRINHPHIVSVQDFVEDFDAHGRPRAYCVMEYVDGQTLAELVKAEPLSVERVVRIITQVCRALEAAHAVGVIHRDVKPENVLVTRGSDGRDVAKVLDFGVAKLVKPDPEIALRRTHDGALIGTPRYMSPEQAASLDVDFRTDVYGVGCLLYELITGRAPFVDDSFGPLVARILTQPPEPPPRTNGLGEVLPAGLVNLTLRCLEKDPGLRPQRLEDVRALLLQTWTQPEPKKQRLQRLAQAGAPFAAFAAVALFLALRPAPAEPVVEPLTALPPLQAPTPQPQDLLQPTPGVISAVEQAPGTAGAADAAQDTVAARGDGARKASLQSRTSSQGRAGSTSAARRSSRDAVLDPFAD